MHCFHAERVSCISATDPNPARKATSRAVGWFGSGSVLLKPAPEGTGLIAGGAVRAVVESCGIQNVLTKSLGSANPHNMVRTTFANLMDLKDPAQVARFRSKEEAELVRA